jgi:hypothetical protein
VRGPCQRPWWYREERYAQSIRRRAVALAVVLGVALLLSDAGAPQWTPHVAPQPEAWGFVQVEDQAEQSRPLPGKPFPGQKTKRCDDEGAVLINGGCWQELKRQPPCGRYFLDRGACWIPVPEDPKKPVAEPPRPTSE